MVAGGFRLVGRDTQSAARPACPGVLIERPNWGRRPDRSTSEGGHLVFPGRRWTQRRSTIPAFGPKVQPFRSGRIAGPSVLIVHDQRQPFAASVNRWWMRRSAPRNVTSRNSRQPQIPNGGYSYGCGSKGEYCRPRQDIPFIIGQFQCYIPVSQRGSQQFCPAQLHVVGFNFDPLQDNLLEVLPFGTGSSGRPSPPFPSRRPARTSTPPTRCLPP